MTRAELYGYDAKNGQPDPLAKPTVLVWIRKGSTVSHVSYHSSFHGFGIISYEGRLLYAFIKELPTACQSAERENASSRQW
jgi:hypothetical protein